MEKIIRHGRIVIHVHDDGDGHRDPRLEGRPMTPVDAVVLGLEAAAKKSKAGDSRDAKPKRLGRHKCRARGGWIGG